MRIFDWLHEWGLKHLKIATWESIYIVNLKDDRSDEEAIINITRNALQLIRQVDTRRYLRVM